MKETINFELTFDDLSYLVTVLNLRICYLEGRIKSYSQNRYGFSADDCDKFISMDKEDIKVCSSLSDKLRKIYFDNGGAE